MCSHVSSISGDKSCGIGDFISMIIAVTVKLTANRQVYPQWLLF
jgi:hypothetical protein